MVDEQVLIRFKLHKHEINRNVVARKPDLTYDLEAILEKLPVQVKVYE